MKLKEDFFLRVIGDKAVIVPTGKMVSEFNKLISLNSTGRFICELLKENRTENEISEALAEEYEIDIDQAKQDTAAYLLKLNNLGIIE